MINIEILPAGVGDTLIVTCIPDANPENEINILIDCGQNYRISLKPRLIELNTNKKDIDLFVITHYDSDHIISAPKFITENGPANSPEIIKLNDVWLNGFTQVLDAKKEELTSSSDEKNETKLRDYTTYKRRKAVGEDEIGAYQALSTNEAINKFGYNHNLAFAGRAICTENDNEIILNQDVTLRLLSPTKAELANLLDDFVKELRKNEIKFADSKFLLSAYETFIENLAAQEDLKAEGERSGILSKITEESIKELSSGSNYVRDDSATNASSIAFVLYCERQKVLMLADAHSETIIENIKSLDPNNQNYPFFFDAIKVSHHGSFRNANPQFFKTVDSPVFIFSTNGRHPSHVHPDLQTIAMIINRPLPQGVEVRELVFNYDLPHISGFINEELQKKYNYKITIAQRKEIYAAN